MEVLTRALQVLLADAEDRRPALEEGLPAGAVETAPKPKRGPRGADATHWDAPDRDPNLLEVQRWAVLAPKGEDGDRLLREAAPLISLREREQGAAAKIFRVDAGQWDARAALAFKNEEVFAEAVPELERPRYLLILGDLHEVSVETQHVLSNGCFVGRLCGDGLRAYAEKVVGFAERPGESVAPDFLVHAAEDGTEATAAGRAQLTVPALALASAWQAKDSFRAESIAEVRDFLSACRGRARPSVMLSVSHGLGSPRGGWGTIEEQRRLQGALVLDAGATLSAESIGREKFLPGGAWFCVACFGAGTPAASVYQPWLTALKREGAFSGRVDSVLKSLPKEGDRPFVAALPRAVLAAAQGPLAVIGHVDLAWTHAFTGEDGAESRASRILSAIKVLSNGSRAGVALDALMRAYREANDALTASYQAEEDAKVRGRPDPTDQAKRAKLWMTRNDLRGYVLLGDPAVRLPLGGTAVARPDSAIVPVGSSVSASSAAVEALLAGDQTPRAISERFGVSLEQLFAWFDARPQSRRG